MKKRGAKNRDGNESFARLHAEVVACRTCPRLVAYRERVAREKVRRYRDEAYWGKPLPGLGDPTARLMIVGLAPAAHGGNRTGRMFTGDRSGDFLFSALHRAGFASQPLSRQRGDGLRLTDCYITAAVRCAPPENKPTPREQTNCRPYLIRELRLLAGLRVVVALGRIGFDAFLRAWRAGGRPLPPERPRFGHGTAAELPDGTWLVAAYHPSQQNTQTGRLTPAMLDGVFNRAKAIRDQRREPRAGTRQPG